MNAINNNRKYLITGAVGLLLFGFLLGSIRTDWFGFAKEASPIYEADQQSLNKPEEALNSARQMETAINYASSKAKPSVVTIYTQKEVSARQGFPFQFGPESQLPDDPFFRRFFGRPEERTRKVQGLGSGVIIREDGYILTNAHVVRNVDEIRVLLNNQESVDGTIVGTDPMGQGTDLAVIKVDRQELPAAEFASSDKVDVGDWSIAIGSPFQLENSVSVGHVSASKRSFNDGQQQGQFPQVGYMIQTDAAINQGNSGGPLVNIEGDIMGINTMIQSTSGGSQGIGFAIASDVAKRVANDLIKHGKVRRPWMGVMIQSLPQQAREEHFGEDNGIIVSRVVEGGPAEQAGLQQGDLIVKFAGETITTPGELQSKVFDQTIDQSLDVVINRDGERQTLTLQLGEMPGSKEDIASSSPDEDNPLSNLGIQVEKLEPTEAREQGLDINRPLLQITSVNQQAPARRTGLKSGDILLKVDNRVFDSKEQLINHLSKRQEAGASSSLWLVRRGSNNFYINVPLSD